MGKMNFLPVLWDRGLSNLFTQVRGGINFHCHDLFTAWFSGCEPEVIPTGPVGNPEGLIQIFAPYGKVVELTFQDYDVLVICTPWGPLEVYSLWKGGGKEYESGNFVFPDGEVVPHDEMNMQESEFILLWEKSYNKVYFGDHHVDFKLRD